MIKADLIAQKEKYTAKVMHGYYERKIDNDTQIDKHLSSYWWKDKYITSQPENCLSAMEDKELPTKCLKNKRARDWKNPWLHEINVDCVLPALKM